METTGYSGTPLVKKLGYKEGQQVLIKNEPPHYMRLLAGLPPVKKLTMAEEGTADLIHLFCTSLDELESDFLALKKALKPNGSFWVSWPKGTSLLETDLNGNIVRNFGLLQGLVDVKVCAVDADWSGLKFMYRIKDRK